MLTFDEKFTESNALTRTCDPQWRNYLVGAYRRNNILFNAEVFDALQLFFTYISAVLLPKVGEYA